MEKIGIITICDYNNYGNRLQNYASQEVMRSLGFEVQTIVNTEEVQHHNIENSLLKRLKNIKKMSIKKIIEKTNDKIWVQLNKKTISISQIERVNSFKNFTRKYITETDFKIMNGNIPNDLGELYDFFVVGSDQVWNPNFRYGSSIDFLTFAPKTKRIAYAPSFGITKIPEVYIENYITWLTDMKELSVREQAGAEIIKKLTGRDATVLVDPTLMLSKEKWYSVSKPALNKPSTKYLLTYFLGEQSIENKKMIKELALKNELEIINLGDIKDLKTYVSGPAEFLDYIKSASVFFTDSFHGAVFSILFEKPFVVFDRIASMPSMSSRIDMLLSTFKLASRKWTNIRSVDDIFNVDYAHVPSILEIERDKSLEFLKSALLIKGTSNES